jgi:alpha-1,2-mannosyltransferase
MGHPFTLPLVSFVSGSRTPLGAYVHYPVISTDMINRVRQGEWGVESGSQGGLKGWRRMGKLA